jgi:hypothetical protein
MSATKKKSPPLPFSQLVEAVKKRSKKEKQKLLDILREEMPVTAPGSQKQFVRKSIKKYKSHPELLILEEDAAEYKTSPKKPLSKKEKEILENIDKSVDFVNNYKKGKTKTKSINQLLNGL